MLVSRFVICSSLVSLFLCVGLGGGFGQDVSGFVIAKIECFMGSFVRGADGELSSLGTWEKIGRKRAGRFGSVRLGEGEKARRNSWSEAAEFRVNSGLIQG